MSKVILMCLLLGAFISIMASTDGDEVAPFNTTAAGIIPGMGVKRAPCRNLPGCLQFMCDRCCGTCSGIGCVPFMCSRCCG